MPSTLERLRKVGARANVIQIAPPRRLVRTGPLRPEEVVDHELVTDPLTSPTGPGGAVGFHNRAGSTISQPHVTNIYLGPFWGDREFVEGFSKAIVENGYLDPLRELGYGTGSGSYLGSVDGPTLHPKSTFTDSDARDTIQKMLAAGVIHGDRNTLFMLILPDKVTSELGNEKSCSAFCGYHDAFAYNGTDIAYAVLPSALCKGCGGQIGDFTAVYAHELAEACTDKVPGKGWMAKDGQENGDLEAWILFGWGPATDPGRYTIQGYYTNERGNTAGAWRSSANDTVPFGVAPANATGVQQLIEFISGCAFGETDFSKKVAEVVPDPAAFQQCVFGKMKGAGFDIKITDIPIGASTTLGDVLAALAQL